MVDFLAVRHTIFLARAHPNVGITANFAVAHGRAGRILAADRSRMGA
jgi:hypothetical protein